MSDFVTYHVAVTRGSKHKKYPNPRCTFSHKNPQKNREVRENVLGSQDTFIKSVFSGLPHLLLHLHFNPVI